MKIGVDLGGTKLRAALAAEDGTLVCKRVVNTSAEGGADAVAQRIAKLVKALPGWESADFIGVGAPCAVSRDGNTLQLASNLPGMDGYPLRDRLSTALSHPVRLENDANAACLGEALFGAGRGCESIVYLTVSTGIGGGIYANGRLLRGARGAAAEFGSMSIDPQRASRGGLPHGAAENELSGTALVERARVLTGQAFAHAGEVFRTAREGDMAIRALVEDFAGGLAVLLSNLACVADPERFVLGGGCMQSKDAFWEALCERYRAFAQEVYRDIPIVAAALEEPGLVGAAMLEKAGR
ncbi:MAG: ROK family protein [Clostridia bacterium]